MIAFEDGATFSPPCTCLKNRTAMTFPKHYSVKTIFGDFGPITIKDLVNVDNTRLDKARWERATT